MEVAIAFYQALVSCLRPLQVFAALALLSYLVSGVPSSTALARALSLAGLLAHCARALSVPTHNHLPTPFGKLWLARIL